MQIPIEEEKIQVAAIQPIRFWLKYKDVTVWDAALGAMKPTGQLKAEEWCEWAKKGVQIPTTVADAVKRLKKDPSAWAAIEPYYNNWKSGGTEEVINGTPLSVWPGVTQDVVECLKPFRIFSVEDLAIANDGVLQRVPNPSMHLYRDRAKKFLATKDIALAVREISEKDSELLKIRAELEALKKAQADSEFARQTAEEKLDEASSMPKPQRRRVTAA